MSSRPVTKRASSLLCEFDAEEATQWANSAKFEDFSPRHNHLDHLEYHVSLMLDHFSFDLDQSFRERLQRLLFHRLEFVMLPLGEVEGEAFG